MLQPFHSGNLSTGVNEDLFNIDGLTDYMADIQWILYPFAFVFLFVINSLLIFAQISLYALVGLFFIKAMQRRGEYRQIWRTAAFAITWATLLSIIFEIFQLSSNWVTLIGIFITMGIY